MSGHDGGEYLDFAKALGAWNVRALSYDARRHDPGWPMLVAAFTWAGRPAIVALALIWTFLAASLAVCAAILRRFSPASPEEIVRILCAVALAYPSHIYYHSFALTESSFLFFLLAGTFAFMSQWTLLAYALAGAAGLIRAPGLLLAVVFLASGVFAAGRTKHVLGFVLALAPQALWAVVARRAWGATSAAIHRPQFGLPFEGFRQLFHSEPAKATYALAVCVFFTSACILLWRAVWRSRARDRFLAVCAGFATAFLVFHLSLKSLRYLGAEVYTPRYIDRYLIGILPFACFAWRKFLRWRVLAVCGAASLGISVYWAHNYSAAAWGKTWFGLTGLPVRSIPKSQRRTGFDSSTGVDEHRARAGSVDCQAARRDG